MVKPTHTIQAIINPSVIIVCLSVFGLHNLLVIEAEMPPVFTPPAPEDLQLSPDQFLFVISLTATIRMPTIAMSMTAPRIAA